MAEKGEPRLDDRVEEDTDFDMDTSDGFMKSVSRKMKKYLCVSGSEDERSRRGSEITSGRSSDSVPVKDFTDIRKTQQGGGDWDSDIYDFSHKKRGLAVIINNEHFNSCQDLRDRRGTAKDASALEHSFKKLGFDILNYKDLPAWKIMIVLKAAASTKYDHKNADCFACAIMSHGVQSISQKELERQGSKVRSDVLYGVDGDGITTKDVIQLFRDEACPGLIGKPRLFFLQACRGCKVDSGQDVTVTRPKYTPGIRPAQSGGARDGNDHTGGLGGRQQQVLDTPDSLPEETFHDPPPPQVEQPPEAGIEAAAPDTPIKEITTYPAPLFQDCLVMYATPPGYFAWRRKSGAWFIQSLCHVLDNDIFTWPRRPFLNVLTRVTKMVAQNYVSNFPEKPEMHEKKAVPVVESKLIKDIYF